MLPSSRPGFARWAWYSSCQSTSYVLFCLEHEAQKSDPPSRKAFRLTETRAFPLVANVKQDLKQAMTGGFFFSGKFFTRSCLFSLLWMLTNFLYIRGLVNLGCTEMISIFATHVSFVYLLSWVVLHEQFVGIRVSVAGDKRTNTNTKAVLYSLGKSTWHNNSSTFF